MLLRGRRAIISALIIVCSAGGFIFGEWRDALVKRQKFLTNEIERATR